MIVSMFKQAYFRKNGGIEFSVSRSLNTTIPIGTTILIWIEKNDTIFHTIFHTIETILLRYCHLGTFATMLWYFVP
jgi:hypothetical protein